MTKQMRNADRPLEHRIAAAIGRLARGDRRARIPDDATDLVEVLHACKREIERRRAGKAGMTETIRWVRASERMPDADETVLIYAPDAFDATCEGWFDGAYWRDQIASIVLRVTHWAEMPKGPTA